MNKNDEIRLRHMLDSAREALEFSHGLTRQTIAKNRMALQAIVRSLEIIGEAAAQISRTTRDQFPEITWEPIVGMRNRLIHAYFDINTEIVWSTIINDLPQLILQLEKILNEN